MFSVRLHSIKCIEESDESSDADEPYILVTSCILQPPIPPRPARTLRYGEWEHFDDGEILDLIGERPFWGMEAEPWEPEPIGNADDVCFVVTVMEHDHGPIDTYQGLVEAAATVSVATTLGMTERAARVRRLIDAIKSSLAGTALPALDNHVATKEVRLDGSDLAIPAGTSKDKLVVFDGGDNGKWELVFRIVHHERMAFAPTSRLAAVSRASDLMELWAVDNAGLLRGNWFWGRWHGWYKLPGPVAFPAGANLAAVSRNSDHMEVWGVAQDGQVWGIWYENPKWRDWYPLEGAAFPPGSPVAAVSRHPDRMEVWAIDTNGQVRSKHFDEGWHPEGGWHTLNGVKFLPGAHLVAASRNENHMQIWVVGNPRTEPVIHSNEFDGTSWLGWDKLDGVQFTPNTRLAAVVLTPEIIFEQGKLPTVDPDPDMHLLAVDENQHVRDFWHEGVNERGWYQAGTEFFATGTAIAAVSRREGVFEAWSITNDGTKRGDAHGPDWQGWYPLDERQGNPPTNVTNPLFGDVAAVTMDAYHMEVWIVGSNGVMGNSFRDGGWQGWYPLRWSFVQ